MDTPKLERLVDTIQAKHHYAEDGDHLKHLLESIADDLCTRPELVDVVNVLVDACPASAMRYTPEATARRILALMDGRS